MKRFFFFFFFFFFLSLSDGFGGLQKYISNDKLFHFIMEKNMFSKDVFWGLLDLDNRLWLPAFRLVKVNVNCVQPQRELEQRACCGRPTYSGDTNEPGTREWPLPGLRGLG